MSAPLTVVSGGQDDEVMTVDFDVSLQYPQSPAMNLRATAQDRQASEDGSADMSAAVWVLEEHMLIVQRRVG